jgi:hypothetical protein
MQSLPDTSGKKGQFPGDPGPDSVHRYPVELEVSFYIVVSVQQLPPIGSTDYVHAVEHRRQDIAYGILFSPIFCCRQGSNFNAQTPMGLNLSCNATAVI